MALLPPSYRGTTAPGRLALLDEALLAMEAPLLCAEGPAEVVDLGLGSAPWTTLELRAALDTLRPPPPLVGVDHDGERVAAARAHARPGLSFEQGDLDRPPGSARLVRAMNLLRDGPPEAVAEARSRMAAALVPGGLLVEGTSNREGDALCAWWLRQGPAGLDPEGLLLATDGRGGAAPLRFLRWLPRDLRARGQTTPAARALLDAWSGAWSRTPGEPLERLLASAEALGARRVTPRAAWFPAARLRALTADRGRPSPGR